MSNFLVSVKVCQVKMEMFAQSILSLQQRQAELKFEALETLLIYSDLAKGFWKLC